MVKIIDRLVGWISENGNILIKQSHGLDVQN